MSLPSRSQPPGSGSGVAGVIPCAGASRRMGASKALLDAGGRSFLAAAIGALTAGGCDPVVVVLGEGQADEERKALDAGAVILVNPDPGEGPITSLRVALAALGDGVDAIAVLPVDHPGVRPETVTALVETLMETDAPLAVPTFEGKRGHPALFRRSVFPELLDPTLEGGARTVVHAHLPNAVLVPVGDVGVVTDIDTPEEYRRAFPARTS